MAKLSIPKIDLPPLQVPQTTGEWKRTVLWMIWTLNLLLNLIYIILTFITSSKMANCVNQEKVSLHDATWRAPGAAAVLGGLMVLMFDIMSCVILIRKSINRSGPGFGYGFLMAWCFVLSFFLFLCGLVLSGFSDVINQCPQIQNETFQKFSKYDAGLYRGTIVFAFICAAFYMFFFVCLVIFQGGIMKTTGLYDVRQDEKRKMEMAALARANAMGPLNTAPQSHTI